MKKFNETYVIGIDHGYGNMKTANCCFPTGVIKTDTEPTFVSDLLVWNGKYYSIEVGHKEFTADKFTDEDYYVLTLAAIARELRRERITNANVFIAAGLPLTWVSEQKADFKKYLLQHNKIAFTFRNTEYRIKIVGAEIYPQGFAAVAEKLGDFKGVNMLCDIGNGTMNLLRIVNKKPDAQRIEVHNSEKGEDGLKHVPIDISFTAVGIINIPTEKELIAAMEEMRENPLKSA